VTESTRPAGWYPDPWGTEHERYFDGASWARTTRPTGSPGDAAPRASGAADLVDPVATLGEADAGMLSAPPATAPGPPTDAVPGTTPPGWHRDPWGLAATRWWDGNQWTGYVSGPPAGAVGVPNVQSEKSLAARLRPALLVGGVAQAVALVGSVDQAQWIVDHWDALTRPSGGQVPEMPATTSTSLAQFGALVGFAVAILFLVWFHRAASTAWASGLPARRSPLLATLSFIIPVLNLWWPYQATLDMVPADDPGRVLIRWWWVAWLSGTLCGVLVYPAAAVFDEVAARVVAAVGALAMLLAAFAARSVVEHVTSTHDHLNAAAV